MSKLHEYLERQRLAREAAAKIDTEKQAAVQPIQTPAPVPEKKDRWRRDTNGSAAATQSDNGRGTSAASDAASQSLNGAASQDKKPQPQPQPQMGNVNDISNAIAAVAAEKRAAEMAQSPEISLNTQLGTAPTKIGDITFAEFRENLTWLANNIENRAAIGGGVRKIMQDLQTNPQFAPQLVNTDMALIVRGARASALMATRKSAERIEKKTAQAAQEDKFLAMLKNSGIQDLMRPRKPS